MTKKAEFDSLGYNSFQVHMYVNASESDLISQLILNFRFWISVPKAKKSRRVIESDEEEEAEISSAVGKEEILDTSLEKKRAEGSEVEDTESPLDITGLDDSRINDSLNSSHVVRYWVQSKKLN